jgi:hypothetical protein
MAVRRRRWRYRDPSWPHFVWLYGLAAIFAFLNSNRLALGVGVAVVTTALLTIKVLRGPTEDPS